MKCAHCGLEFEASKYNHNQRFCTKRCAGKYYYEDSSVATSNVSQKKRASEKKIRLVKELGGKCHKCGYAKNYAALEFHHKNKGSKDFNISGKHCLSYARLLEEAKKCILVCANCHAEIHNPQALLA